MERRNVSVWISTVKGYQYIHCKIGERQLYLGSIELVRELVDELNARGINGAGISVTPEDIKLAKVVREVVERLNGTPEDIKLAEKAEEMTAAAEARTEEAEAQEMMKRNRPRGRRKRSRRSRRGSSRSCKF